MIYLNAICESTEPTESYLEFQDYLKKNFLYGVIIGQKLYEDPDSEIFLNHYKSLTPKQFARNRSGVCWDYVAYELEWFNKYHRDLKPVVYYIEAMDEKMPSNCPTHTWIGFQDKLWLSDIKPYKAFEVSWEWNAGIWEYRSEKDMLNGYLEKFIKFYKFDKNTTKYCIYSLTSLEDMYNLSCTEYMDKWHENGKLLMSNI